MIIINFILDIIAGLLIIGDPLWLLVSSPLYITLSLIILLLFWSAHKLMKADQRELRYSGYGLVVVGVISILGYIIFSGFREWVISILGIEAPIVSFRNVSWLQWLGWGFINFVINTILNPKSDNSDKSSQEVNEENVEQN